MTFLIWLAVVLFAVWFGPFCIFAYLTLTHVEFNRSTWKSRLTHLLMDVFWPLSYTIAIIQKERE